MLFQTALRKELSRQFLATTVVLVTIVLTIMLIRTLGQASRGQVAPSEVGLVLGFSLLANVPVLLIMSLFIATVSVLSRQYAESEMAIWFSSGQGLSQFVKPVFRFAWPYLLLCLGMMVVVWPWSNQQVSELRQRFEQRGDLQRVSPGEFQESANGKRVFFVDKNSNTLQGQQIFVATLDPKRQTFTSARSGHLSVQDQQRLLTLENGQRLDVDLDTQDFRLSQFKSYDVLVGETQIQLNQLPLNATPTLNLLAAPEPRLQGELSWRVGLGLTGVNLLLLALLLTGGSHRRNRNLPLVLALLAFVSFFNFLNLGQAWIAVSRIGMVEWMLLFHGGTFVALSLLLWGKHRQWRLLPARRSAA